MPLLVAGAKVWLGNNVAFAFLYWEFDGGGPAARAHGMPPLSGPRLPAADQPRPGAARLATAVHRLPVRRVHDRQRLQPDGHDADGPWAKVAMGSQALISFAIVGLVIARVVNLFQ